MDKKRTTDNDWAQEKVHALLTRLVLRSAELLFWMDELWEEE